MKKVLSVLAGAILLFGSATIAFATTPQIVQLPTLDASSTPYTANITTQNLNGSTVWLMGFDPTTGAPASYYINSGLYLNGSMSGGIGQLDITNTIGMDKIVGLVGFQTDTDTALSSANSSISSLNSTVTSNSASLVTINALDVQVNANLFGSSTTMTAQNASTTNGLMTKAQSVKLDAMASNLPWSWATSTHSIVTGTGATGFLVSSTRNSTLHENVKITTTASIAGNADGYIALEVAPTNSATSTDWIEKGRCGNSQALTLAITLQSVQGTTCELVGDVPAGYYSKLRSVTTTGTVSFAFVSGQEVLK